ncbi:hypothetical protein OSSY52_13680 [Tepiditoga spiralis]|uniref:DUF3147 family protein n=1 Tax=Tepiditoga spiralis TaxID=2108365 RepID=A0A7G1G8F1_9BACT|nr:DUF3147 family protein [Tepiditoga spiralis]BBE31227.1 hypothetical protein OSSY52_13680 [Tepiditoga spiralis]
MKYLFKLLISALIIVFVSEFSKKFSWIGGLIASLPLISIISIFWLYNDTKDIVKVTNLSLNIFWFVIPSLIFFIMLPFFLKYFPFYLSMIFSSIITIIFYIIFSYIISKIGVKI